MLSIKARGGISYFCKRCEAAISSLPCPICGAKNLEEQFTGSDTPHQPQMKNGINSMPLDCSEETIKTLRGDYL